MVQSRAPGRQGGMVLEKFAESSHLICKLQREREGERERGRERERETGPVMGF